MADDAFSPAQLAQLRQVFREEWADAGLRLDGPDHVDDARADFRFIRRLRQGVDGVAGKVGMAVILAVLGGIGWLVMQGVNLWRGS